jgi:putative protease
MLQAVVNVGDRLRLYDERTGDRKSFTLRSLEVNGRAVEQGGPGQSVTIRLLGADLAGLRPPLQGVLFRVDISGRKDQQKSSLARSVAKQQLPPTDPAHIEKMMLALSRPTGQVKTATGVSSTAPRRKGRAASRGESSAPEWWIRVHSLEALAQRFPFKVAKVLIDLNKQNLEQYLHSQQRRKTRPVPLVWALPPVMREEQLPWYQEAIGQLRHLGAEQFQISHLGQISLFVLEGQSLPTDAVKLYGDYTANVLNNPALQTWASLGLSGMQFSLETDRQTLADAVAHFTGSARTPGRDVGMKVGLQLYGRPPLFTARLDAPHFQGQRSLISSRSERYYLDRRDEALYVRAHAAFSLLQYAGELAKIGLDYFVVDVSHGQVKKECAEVTALLSGRGDLPEVFSGNYAGILS